MYVVIRLDYLLLLHDCDRLEVFFLHAILMSVKFGLFVSEMI